MDYNPFDPGDDNVLAFWYAMIVLMVLVIWVAAKMLSLC